MKGRLEKLMAYMLDRLGETSTIQGLAAIVTLGTGLVVTPDKLAAVAALAAGVSAMLKILLPDSWKK